MWCRIRWRLSCGACNASCLRLLFSNIGAERGCRRGAQSTLPLLDAENVDGEIQELPLSNRVACPSLKSRVGIRPETDIMTRTTYRD